MTGAAVNTGDRDRSRNGSAVFQTCAGWMTAFAANAGRLRIPIFIFSLECRKRAVKPDFEVRWLEEGELPDWKEGGSSAMPSAVLS